MKPPIPPDEDARVAALYRFGVLDQPPAPDLEELCWLAATLCETPVAGIALIDTDRQFLAATYGMPCMELHRDDSMCVYTVATGKEVIVSDCSLDPRFANKPFVDGTMASLRLYVSIPLKTDDGHTIGGFCVGDMTPRTLTERQIEGLRKLANQVIRAFEMRLHTARLIEATSEADHRATHDNITGLVNRQTLVDRIEVALAKAQRTGVPPTLLFCDVDRFRTVNHLFGPHVGDAVLAAVAGRILRAVRPWDTAARLANDQFVIACEDMDAEAAERMRLRLISEVTGPVGTNVGTVMVSVRVVRVSASPEDSVLDVLRIGDARLAAVKHER